MATQQPDRFGADARANRWQDWTNLVLAIWFFISPWVLQFGGGLSATGPAAGGAASAASTAAWDAWVLGVLVFLVSLSALPASNRMEFWQEWINLLLGIWIFIAPWVLGFAGAESATAAWDHWVVGALIVIVSVSNLSTTRRAPGGIDYARAGSKPKSDF